MEARAGSGFLSFVHCSLWGGRGGWRRLLPDWMVFDGWIWIEGVAGFRTGLNEREEGVLEFCVTAMVWLEARGGWTWFGAFVKVEVCWVGRWWWLGSVFVGCAALICACIQCDLARCDGKGGAKVVKGQQWWFDDTASGPTTEMKLRLCIDGVVCWCGFV